MIVGGRGGTGTNVLQPPESGRIDHMSRRFQFSLRWLFVAMMAVACFFGGIRFERERRRRENEALAGGFVQIAVIEMNCADRVTSVLHNNGIDPVIEGSIVYGVSVRPGEEQRALSLLRADDAANRYSIQFR
jgi:hypothetical protein